MVTDEPAQNDKIVPGFPQLGGSELAASPRLAHHGTVARRFMRDRPGIGVEDLPWIHWEQFVHYLTVARSTNDPHDWPILRPALLAALTAAFGLDDDDGGWRAAAEVVDLARCDHDPATSWSEFMEMVWARRHAIRPDIT